MISILCPTRNRPDSVRRLLDSVRDTAVSETEAVFYEDEDAPGSVPEDCRARGWVTVVTGPRITLSQTWNECYRQAGGDVMMMCADDIVFRTPGWDLRVVNEFEKFEDKIVLVHGNDLYQRGSIASHGFLHVRWTQALGYFTPPYFSCDWVDMWLNDIADALERRRYLPDVVTEHLHPVAGKAEWDATHRERIARGQADHVAELYEQLAPERDKAVHVLRRLML